MHCSGNRLRRCVLLNGVGPRGIGCNFQCCPGALGGARGCGRALPRQARNSLHFGERVRGRSPRVRSRKSDCGVGRAPLYERLLVCARDRVAASQRQRSPERVQLRKVSSRRRGLRSAPGQGSGHASKGVGTHEAAQVGA